MGYLLSTGYDDKSKRIFLKFYKHNAPQISLTYDSTGYLPYCLTNVKKEKLEKSKKLASIPSFSHIEEVVKKDPFSNKDVLLSKIIVNDPYDLKTSNPILWSTV